MGPIQTIEEAFDFLRRRAWLIGAVLCAGIALSVWYALSQPHVYRSTAVLHLETAKVADTLAPSTVEDSASRRLREAEQRILSRDNLQRMIDAFGLFTDRPGMTTNEKVMALRHAITFRWTETRVGRSEMDTAVTGVAIIVDDGDPGRAARLANDLADQVIALAREARQERTRTTAEFFAEREEAIAAEVAALEERIAAFKGDNDTTVDGGLQFRRVELSSLQETLLGIERERVVLMAEIERLAAQEQVRVVSRRVEELRDDVASLDTQRELLLARSAEVSQTIQTAPQVQQQLSILAAQLERMQEQHMLALQARADAETAHRLELANQAERLLVMETALPGDYPVAPNRKKIALRGAVLSLMLALAAAFLLEVRRPVIRTAQQMERELGLLPVVSIPYLPSPAEARRPRLRLRAAGIAGLVGAVVLVAIAAGAALPA